MIVVTHPSQSVSGALHTLRYSAEVGRVPGGFRPGALCRP